MEKQMNRPQLRFPEFKGEWELKKLASIADVKTGPFGSSLHQHDYVEIGTPIITVEHLDELGIVHKNLPLVSDEDKSRLKSYHLKTGDLVFSRVGSVDRCSLISERENGWLFSGRLLRVRFQNQIPAFFNYQFQLETSKQKVRSIAVGQTMPSINTEILKSIELTIATLPEQIKIATFLTAVDEKIQALKKKHSLLEDYKKGVMQKLFSQKLRFKDDNGNSYPIWQNIKLGDVLYEHKLKSTGKEEVYSVSVHKGLINQIEHLGRSYAANNTDNYNLVKPNDIVYTKSPTGNFPLGIIKQSKIHKSVIVSPLYGVFTPQSKGLGYLLNVHFESPLNTSNYLGSLIQKGAKNTINITNSTFLSKEILLPISISEQEKIGDFLYCIDKKIENIESLICEVENWKKGLLQKLFC